MEPGRHALCPARPIGITMAREYIAYDRADESFAFRAAALAASACCTYSLRTEPGPRVDARAANGLVSPT